MRSILGTMNHLYAADVLLYCRASGKPAMNGAGWTDFTKYWNSSDAGAVLQHTPLQGWCSFVFGMLTQTGRPYSHRWMRVTRR